MGDLDFSKETFWSDVPEDLTLFCEAVTAWLREQPGQKKFIAFNPTSPRTAEIFRPGMPAVVVGFQSIPDLTSKLPDVFREALGLVDVPTNPGANAKFSRGIK